MESLIGTVFFVLVLIWAFRIETNTAKTVEALNRIEKRLAENDTKKGKK